MLVDWDYGIGMVHGEHIHFVGWAGNGRNLSWGYMELSH